MIVAKVLSVLIVCNYMNFVHNHTIHAANGTDLHLEYVLLDEETHPCNRPCAENGTPMTCRYQFLIEWYQTLSKACYDCPFNRTDCYRPDCIPGDGTRRSVVVVNRKMPGPSIEVCVGDEIVVDVTNGMVTDGTTIHWHGQHVKDHPYMDGVPFVTQCPILPGNTFRYSFKAMQVGTHFWHSHIGMQRADGLFGPLIVRKSKDIDKHTNLYDYDLSDHIIVIIDWGQVTGVDKFLSHHHNIGDNKPTTLLINGLGRFAKFDPERNLSVFTPTARFAVEESYRYRFRIINAGFLNCPIEISIENHTFTVINSDGNDLNPVEVTSLISYAGERFDIILNANQTPGLYWMRFKGLLDCAVNEVFQTAVLEYKQANSTTNQYPNGNPNYNDEPANGTQVNSLNVGTENDDPQKLTMPELESLETWDSSLQTIPDYKFFISYDFYEINNEHYHKFPLYGFNNVTDPRMKLLTPQLNHISFKSPAMPLLSQRNEIDESLFCNETAIKNCTYDYCECPHVLQVPLNAIVEMILVDEGVAYDANHPLHLHGHAFRVVGMQRMGPNVTLEQVKELDRSGNMTRNLLDAPVKDTVTVPDGGYTIIRFNASNPGYWFFHCHLEFHAEIGMALVVKVGEKSEMLPVPKNFPTCGNYIPLEENNNNTKTNCEKTSLVKQIENLFTGDENCDDPNSSSINKIKYTILMALTILPFLI